MTNYREILRLGSLGLSQKQIAEATGLNRKTISAALQRAQENELDYLAVTELSDREIASKLYPQGEESGRPAFKMPDYERVHAELAKPNVTLQLLWFEYVEKCRQTGEIPYQLTQFKKYYREFAAVTKATMHINRKPGELMEVDWAGQTAGIVDTDTGEIIDAYIFVAVLPYSGYGYVEAFLSRDQSAWLAAHVNAYEYFGGVTRILVPDNLKTGVIKHTKNEIILNKAYQELAEYYGTAIIPTRVRAPKDKATVEGLVGTISVYILASIRNERFFSVAELNAVIKKLLYSFNHKPFQRKDGSRASLFADERQSLLPLPRTPFELSEWRTATVQFNYHVLVADNYYSVPFEYIRRKVDIRISRNTIEIFADNNRISSHVRVNGKRGVYVTADEHMPPNHQAYERYDADYFRRKAAEIGENIVAVVEGILTTYKVPQQGFKACMTLLRAAEQYGGERLENACSKALSYSPRPSCKTIQAILKTGQDKLTDPVETSLTPSEHSFTRGAEYYGRGGQK